MSDNIPFEIQSIIIKSFPVKSLIQFRSVSKQWKCLIDSSDFITRYSRQTTLLQHLLVKCDRPVDPNKKYVSIAEDDSFPQHQVSLTLPLLVSLLKHSIIISNSHGLFCLYIDDPDSGKGMVVLWNLSIQKAVAVVVPNVEAGMTYGTVLGFGVCRKTSDPKIVKIVFIDSWDEMETLSCHPNHVEVFALSEGVWRSPLGNVPRKSLHFDACEGSVAIDGVVYWLATDRIMTHAGPNYYNLIVSFDATSEEFGEVHLPHRLSQVDDYNLSISKLRNHVVILELHRDEKGYGVWMMQSDVCIPFFVDSFVRIFSINSPDASVKGFRKTGEPVIELMEDGHRPLVVYDPSSTNVIFLENDVYANSFCVYPYVESLLLLDQPDFTIYDNGKATLNEELAREAFEAYM